MTRGGSNPPFRMSPSPDTSEFVDKQMKPPSDAERIPGLGFRLETESSSRRAIEVTVPAAVFEEAVQEELRRIRRRAHLRGFRKGKAPLERIERAYGDDARERAISRLVARATRESLHELGVAPLDTPEARIEGAERGGALTARLTFSVWPDLGTVDFSGIEVEDPKSSITESDIGETLEQMRIERATPGPITDRGIQDDDFVVGDLEESDTAEGSAWLRKTEGVAFRVGTGAYHPALHEALQGAQAGDTVIATARFGEESPDPDRAGRALRAQFEIGKAAMPVLPPLDDAFARSVGANSLLALRGDIRDRLRERAAADDRRELANRLVAALLEKNPVEPPVPLVQGDLDNRVQLLAAGMEERGIPPEQVEAELRRRLPELRANCESTVASAILLDALADQENIEASEEVVSERIGALAERQKKTPAALRAAMEGDGQLDRLRTGLRRDAAIEFLRERARRTTV